MNDVFKYSTMFTNTTTIVLIDLFGMKLDFLYCVHTSEWLIRKQVRLTNYEILCVVITSLTSE